MKQGEKLARQHRNDDVGAAIVIVILKDHAHPRNGLAVHRQRRPGIQRNLLKSAVAGVVVEVLLHAVVGHNNVRETVLIVVRERTAQRSPLLGGNPGTLADILERAVPTIVIEQIGSPGKFTRRAVRFPGAAANLVVIGVPFHITGHEEIEMAVVVVIEETRGTRPASASDACFCRNISERSVAIIVVQDILPIIRDKQVGIAIVVVVAYGHRYSIIAIARIGQPGGLRDVCKASVAILAVQPIPVARIAALKILRNVQVLSDSSTVHEKNIQEAVVVVVEQRNPARHRLDQEFLSGRRILEDEIHSPECLYVKHGRRGSGRSSSHKIAKNWHTGSQRSETQKIAAVETAMHPRTKHSEFWHKLPQAAPG